MSTSKVGMDLAELTGQIANSYAQQLDRNIEAFLKKNLIPFNGDIAKTNEALEAKGMRLIREDDPLDIFGNRTTTYMLIKIIDTTTITIKAPTILPTPVVEPETPKQSKDQEG